MNMEELERKLDYLVVAGDAESVRMMKSPVLHAFALLEKRKEQWRRKANHFGRKTALQGREIANLKKMIGLLIQCAGGEIVVLDSDIVTFPTKAHIEELREPGRTTYRVGTGR
jgi:hypothetical protein